MNAWYRVSFRAYASQNIARNESVINKLNQSSKVRKRLPIQTLDVLASSGIEAEHIANVKLLAGGGVSYVEISGARPLKSELTESQARELLTHIDAERARMREVETCSPLSDKALSIGALEISDTSELADN